MMDFGYPQTTETKILQEYITQESHKLEVQARPPIAVTNAVSWRSEGIRYRKNEVFLDVVESLNLLVSASGNVLRSEILGAIKMKCYLSGMPELRLGLNDKAMFETTGRATRGKAVEMEDVKFHQCVRLSRFENDRTISFIPPDGEFELMSYRLNTQVKPLIWVESNVRSHSGSRIEYVLKTRAQFKRRSTANNVEIIVPVPSDADTPRFRTSIGSVHYAPEKSAIVWKIKQFGGSKEFMMRAELGLPSVKGDDEHGGGMTGGFGGSMGGIGGGKGKRPIQVKFEIPYFTTSGIQVRYLKIIEPKVSPIIAVAVIVVVSLFVESLICGLHAIFLVLIDASFDDLSVAIVWTISIKDLGFCDEAPIQGANSVGGYGPLPAHGPGHRYEATSGMCCSFRLTKAFSSRGRLHTSPTYVKTCRRERNTS